MGFLTQKRQIDTVSLVSVIVATAALTFLACWLYYGGQLNKMQSSYDMKVDLIKDQIEIMRKKNAELKQKLDSVKEVMSDEVQPDQE